VLNAKQHEREATIVEGAGQLGAVMIATNMAGRGTDIKLQPVDRKIMLDHWLRRGIAPRDASVDDDEQALRQKVYRKIAPKALGVSKRDVESMSPEDIELALLRHWVLEHTWADDKKVRSMGADDLRTMLDEQGRFAMHRLQWIESIESLGGLHVIGTERHESRRIDNQLRGRSGRQGDQGSTRFFVSLDDELMKLFAGQTTMKVLSRLGMKEGDAIEHPMLSKAIVRAQRKVEERNFQIRKNILEYDEVMEHQRQDFYGMRQRVLDGRDIRGLIFDFIEEAALTAVDKYLDKDYSSECVATLASEQLKTSVPTERIRGKDKDEVIATVRRVAREDARAEIGVTIGEYIPDGATVEDIDTKGLVAWADSRFSVKLTSDEVLSGDTKLITDRLEEAAYQIIDDAELDGVEKYLVANYGEHALCEWLDRTMGLEFSVEKIIECEQREDVVALVLDRVQTAYDKREVEYPVDFMLELTMGLMRQNAQSATENLVRWANTRYELGWDETVLRTRMPQQIREDLLKASAAFVESGRLDKAIDDALACADDEALEEHLRDKYNAILPLWMRRLKGEDRENAIRARIEGILRSELVWFEQTVLLQVLDPLWKDHLYAMDQLRDAIGYRAFSQQDPRIEYKREGARLYKEMLERVRDQVTEYVFKARIMPQVGPPQRTRPAAAPAQAAPQPRQQAPAQQGQGQQQAQQQGPPPGRRPASAAAQMARMAGQPMQFGSGSISGPGLDAPDASKSEEKDKKEG
ncbi:MAG: hypothetical protein AAFX05_10550, partial [Planctomycetota bacterium]